MGTSELTIFNFQSKSTIFRGEKTETLKERNAGIEEGRQEERDIYIWAERGGDGDLKKERQEIKTCGLGMRRKEGEGMKNEEFESRGGVAKIFKINGTRIK